MGKFTVLAMFAAGLISVADAHQPHSRFTPSMEIFYSSLDGQGEWIYVDRDIYAWRPARVHEGWRPYTVGRWAWTNDGWYWVSDESWGWATYHYGRWFYDDFYGWMWIPGAEWSPAWVEWRYGDDCVGWAPLGPYASFSASFGVRHRNHWVTPGFWWSFVDCRYVGSPDVHRYVYRSENNTRYIGRTRSTGGVRYEGGRIVSRGPERDYVERHGKTRIEQVDLGEAGDGRAGDNGESVVRKGGRDRIEVYRPEFGSRERGAERPSRVRETDRRVSLDVDDIAAPPADRDSKVEQGRERRDERRAPAGIRPDDTRMKKQRETDHSAQEPARRGSGTDVSSDRRDQRRNDPASVGGRKQQESSRSANPERTIRRPEQRQPENPAGKGGGRRR